MRTPPDLSDAYREHVAVLEQAYGRALADAGLDAVLIHSGRPKPRTEFDDQFWSLRPTPHFQHWLPLAEPGCALLVRLGARPRLVWLKEKNFWERPGPPPGTHWQEAFDLVEIERPEELGRQVPEPRARVAFVGEDRSVAVSLELDERMNPPALVRALDRARTLKTRYEVLCLDEANHIASLGHRLAADGFLAEPMSELELHLLYLRATRQDDPETPYKNIVAFNANAATLHHVSYGRRPPSASEPRSLLLDAGATFMGYASDITRTYVAGHGPRASTFAALVAGVEKMQQELCAEAKIGMPYEQLHDRAHQKVGQVLVDLKIVRGSAEEAVSSGVTRTFLPHGLGHSLGLQCHDVGCAEVRPRADNPFLRNTTTIAPGQVFTIEPGIYFIDTLLGPLRSSPAGTSVDWRLVDELTRLGGVRIEDNLHVPQEGELRNFTRRYLPH